MTDAYAKGYTDGSTKGKVYDPPWNYTFQQKLEYRNGYKDARDD